MRNLKKSLSLILALALLVSSVFVGGITASAATELVTTTMTYDDEGAEFVYAGTDIYNAQGSTYISMNGEPQTDSNAAGYKFLSIWNATVQNLAEAGVEDDGNALRYQKANSFKGSWLSRAAIYDSNSDTLERLKATKGVTYQISLKYYVAKTPTYPVALSVRNGGEYKAVYGNYDWSDTGYTGDVWCDAVFTADKATDGWVEATAFFTANSNAYPHLVLSGLRDGNGASNVDVWIDDVTVTECVDIAAYNYYGDTDGVVHATDTTTVAELGIPERADYYLNGIFADAELTTRVYATDLAINYAESGLYYDWRELQDGEYFCGFENYTPAIEGASYDAEVSTIVSSDVYNGSYAMKTLLPVSSLTAIELRDKEAFEIKAGVEYQLSFSYKSTADAKIYAGVGKTSNVVDTAYAIKGADLPAATAWTTASLTFTSDKGTTEGFSPVILLSSDSEAEILLDAIYLTYPVEETAALTGVTFSDSTSWYPSLALFDGITIPEASDIWDGTYTEVPTDSDNDGAYEIDTAEKLAYIVKNGGKMYLRTETVIETQTQNVQATDEEGNLLYEEDGTTPVYVQATDEEGNPLTNEDGTPVYVTEEVEVEVQQDVYDTNATFKLTKDIYLNDISKYDWLSATAGSGLKSWITGVAFSGTIDGNYHTVYGLYSFSTGGTSHSNTNGGAGLLPRVTSTATVKNLTIDCAAVRNATYAGAFVGMNSGTVYVDSCVVGENVYVASYKAGVIVGGGGNQKTYVSNCASFATNVSDTTATANSPGTGLVNHYYVGKAVVSNSYNANGPICSGSHNSLTVTNSFETVAGGETEGVTTLTKEQMQGTDVLSISGTMCALNSNGSYWLATEKYPVLSASRGKTVEKYWDGTRLAPVDTSEGTAEDPILISTAKELAYVIFNGGGADKNYKLTNNIFLNNLDLVNWETGETAAGYTPNPWYKSNTSGITFFQGTIDGDGYTVYGLYFDDGVDLTTTTSDSHIGVGLIPRVGFNTKAYISKLGIDNMFINHEAHAGAYVGHCGQASGGPDKTKYAEVYFDQCYVGENVTIIANDAGHYVGRNCGGKQSFTNCYSLANVTGAALNFVAANAGFSGGNGWGGGVIAIENCYNAIGCLYNGGEWPTIDPLCKNNYQGGICSNGIVWYGSQRTTDNMQGLDALTTSTKMPNLNVDSTTSEATTMYTATEGYPVLTAFVGKFYEAPKSSSNGNITEDGEATYDYWDGTNPYAVYTDSAKTKYDAAASYTLVKEALSATAAGTEEDPYKITTAAQLYTVMAGGGEEGIYYQLQNDIYLNDLTKINWETGSVASGYKQNTWRPNVSFSGNIDGNGNTIYGLYYHDGKTDYGTAKSYACGFISKVGSGTVTVKDLGIDNCYFRYDSNTGSFVGSVYSTKDSDGNVTGTGNVSLSGCYAGENVTLVGNYTGLVGFVQDTTTTLSLDRCYSLATCIANTGAGLLGYSYWDAGATVTMSHCYNATGKITGIDRGHQTYTNCYEAVQGPSNTGATVVTSDNMKGDDVLVSSSKMAGLKMACAYIEDEATFAQTNDFVVYLPIGTIFEQAYDVDFFDTRLAPLSDDDVLYKGRMIRGAFVKFNELPDLERVQVPVSKAHRVASGTAAYFFENNYFDIETEVVKENLANQPDSTVNYLFITDTHFDSGAPVYATEIKKQLQLLVDIANANDAIDFVCLGGDLSNGGYTVSHSYTYDVLDADGNQTFNSKGEKITKTEKGYIDSVQSFLEPLKSLNKPVFILTGNHDDNAYSTDTSKYGGYPYNRTFDGVTVYGAQDEVEAFKLKIVDADKWSDGIIDVFVNRTLEDGTEIKVVQNEDVVADNNNADDDFNSKYYYYDLDAKKTRIICLNASDFAYSYDENGNYEPVVKNASSTETYSRYYNGRNFWGYSADQMEWLAEEALGELPEDYNVIFLSHMGIETNVAGTQSGGYTNGPELRKIINAYQNKTTYTNDALTSYSGDAITINADFTETKGKILSYQFGHEHYDASVYNASSDLWQFLTTTINTSPDQADEVYQQVWSEKACAIAVMSVAEGYVYKQDMGGIGETGMYYSTYKQVDGDITLDKEVDIRDLVRLNNLNNAELVAVPAYSYDLEKMRKLLLGIVA